MNRTLEELRAELERFADDRQWGHFHTPRNLGLALAGEVGELLAEIQWSSDDEVLWEVKDAHFRERLAAEAADVLIYLVRFADVCGIDLLDAAFHKTSVNADRFPIE